MVYRSAGSHSSDKFTVLQVNPHSKMVMLHNTIRCTNLEFIKSVLLLSTQQRNVTVKITNKKDYRLLLSLCIKAYLLTFSLCLLLVLMFSGSVDTIERGLLISL